MATKTLRVGNVKTLLASATKTATGTGTGVRLPGTILNLVCTLDVTAAASVAGDTLDVYVQTQLDGANWLDVVHFTQVVGNGGAKRYHTKMLGAGSVAEFEAGTALSAAGHRSIFGDNWRCRWAIGGTSPSFTFSVAVIPS